MSTQPMTSVSVALGRIMWMVIGPLALVLCAFSVAERGNGWLTAIDLLFFGFLAATLLGRYAEYRGGHPTNSTGDPVTPGQLRRYAWTMLLGGVAVWAVANLIGNHLL
jgi:hypothetical protein